MEKVTVELTKEQCGTIAALMDKVPGMENARVLLPIYDALKSAVETADQTNSD